MKNPQGQLARWLLKLSEYNFDIEYRKSSLHKNAGSCSRYPYLDADELPTEKVNFDTLRCKNKYTSTDDLEFHIKPKSNNNSNKTTKKVKFSNEINLIDIKDSKVKHLIKLFEEGDMLKMQLADPILEDYATIRRMPIRRTTIRRRQFVERLYVECDYSSTDNLSTCLLVERQFV